MLVLNDWAVFFNVLFAVGAALTVLMSPRYLEAHGRHLGEYYALVLFAVIGMDLMAAARDFIALLRGPGADGHQQLPAGRLLPLPGALQRVGAQVLPHRLVRLGHHAVRHLAGLRARREPPTTRPSAQALAGIGGPGAGGAPSGVLLAVFLVAIGLAFKVSAAPFHMWTPDVYQGAPTPVAAFFSVGPKAAAFSVIMSAFIVAFPGAGQGMGHALHRALHRHHAGRATCSPWSRPTSSGCWPTPPSPTPATCSPGWGPWAGAATPTRATGC